MSFNLSHCRTVYCFRTRVITKTKQLLGKSHKFCGGRHCFSYCSWPPVQQKSRLLIALNCILLCLNNSSQITKKSLWIKLTFALLSCKHQLGQRIVKFTHFSRGLGECSWDTSKNPLLKHFAESQLLIGTTPYNLGQCLKN